MLARATVQTQSNGNGPGQTLGAGAHNRARFGVRIRVVAIAPDPMGIFLGHVYEGESTPNARPRRLTYRKTPDPDIMVLSVSPAALVMSS